MNIFLYLKKETTKNKEMSCILMGVFLLYFLSWFYWKIGFIAMSYGFLIIVIGGICNLCVMTFNNDKMPVFVKNRSAFYKIKKQNSKRNICILNSKTRLKYLADRFLIKNIVFSVGDFFVFVGFIILFVQFL